MITGKYTQNNLIELTERLQKVSNYLVETSDFGSPVADALIQISMSIGSVKHLVTLMERNDLCPNCGSVMHTVNAISRPTDPDDLVESEEVQECSSCEAMILNGVMI